MLVKDVCREAAAQISRFTELMGQPPHYVDGHQHVHVISTIAPALARLFAVRGVVATRIAWEPHALAPWIPLATRRFYSQLFDEVSVQWQILATC